MLTSVLTLKVKLSGYFIVKTVDFQTKMVEFRLYRMLATHK